MKLALSLVSIFITATTTSAFTLPQFSTPFSATSSKNNENIVRSSLFGGKPASSHEEDLELTRKVIMDNMAVMDEVEEVEEKDETRKRDKIARGVKKVVSSVFPEKEEEDEE